MYNLPKGGFTRLRQIIGDPKAVPPIPPLFPVGKSTWWAGVKSGRFPKPVKLGPRTTAWTNESLLALSERLNTTVADTTVAEAAGTPPHGNRRGRARRQPVEVQGQGGGRGNESLPPLAG